MARFFDPSFLARTYRDPIARASLAVDMLPIVGIVVFGWDAVALIALYWLENLVIGAVMVGRFIAMAMGKVRGAVFILFFFIMHYGTFCYAHGATLIALANDQLGIMGNGDENVLNWALGAGQHLSWAVAAIIALNIWIFVSDYIGSGAYKRDTNPGLIMFSPYGRIVALHVAIIMGAALFLVMDQAILGVLAVLLIRILFGMVLSARRRGRLDAA